MANDIVAGLFGLTPNQIQQQQQAQINQQASAYAQQAPFERAAAGMYKGGAGLGQIGAGMMGMVNPEVEAAKQREAALSQVDFNTPEGILAAAKAAGDRGDTRMSLQLQMLARQRLAEQQEAELKVAKTRKEEMLAEEEPRLRHEEKMAAIAQRAEAAKMRSEDMRLSAQMRADALRESNDLKRMLIEQKLSAPKPISNVDARSIEKSIQTSSGANSAMQLLDQADALYGEYASGRDEPILGSVARWGAAVGLADEKRTADYETASQIAKDLGVIKLGLIGGSDTERELQVAIDTSPSPDKLPSTNKVIIANQRRAIEVLQAEPDFKTEWVNKYGSLSKLNENGEPFGKAWRKYQKENFKPVVTPSTLKWKPSAKQASVTSGVKTWNSKTGQWEMK